jgi:endoplasmic reticulum resident protein 44
MNDVNIHFFISEKKSAFFLANINCLHADGAQFVHPLQHLGKSQADLPLLAIDSFKHMFLFPDIKEMS